MPIVALEMLGSHWLEFHETIIPLRWSGCEVRLFNVKRETNQKNTNFGFFYTGEVESLKVARLKERAFSFVGSLLFMLVHSNHFLHLSGST